MLKAAAKLLLQLRLFVSLLKSHWIIQLPCCCYCVSFCCSCYCFSFCFSFCCCCFFCCCFLKRSACKAEFHRKANKTSFPQNASTVFTACLWKTDVFFFLPGNGLRRPVWHHKGQSVAAHAFWFQSGPSWRRETLHFSGFLLTGWIVICSFIFWDLSGPVEKTPGLLVTPNQAAATMGAG